MRDYGAVSPTFWTGRTGKRLRGDTAAQLLALYLITAPQSTMTGVYYCPLVSIAHETGLGMEGARKALARLIGERFCEYDYETETVFVITMPKFQIGGTLKPDDKRVAGLRKAVKRMPSAALQRRFIDVYDEPYGLGFGAVKASGIEAPSEPNRSQEQEQKQVKTEKEQEPRAREDEKPTAAGLACKAIMAQGILANPTHPGLLAAIAEGVTQAEFEAAAIECKANGKKFAYLISMVRGRKAEAGKQKVAAQPPIGGQARKIFKSEPRRVSEAEREKGMAHVAEILRTLGARSG